MLGTCTGSPLYGFWEPLVSRLSEILVRIHFSKGLEDSLPKLAALAASQEDGALNGIDMLDGEHEVEEAIKFDRS
jgi:hypothetical protein